MHVLLATKLHLHLDAVHVPGHTNVAANALSWNDLARFLQVMPQAVREPALIPRALVNLALMEQLD